MIYFILIFFYFFCFKQKTAYEITRRDWSSDVCSSDLRARAGPPTWTPPAGRGAAAARRGDRKSVVQGKSVPCCVDLGGRRIIKKKKINLIVDELAHRPIFSIEFENSAS